ncbi:hypothetical protein ElyMa_000471000 [Elysia marginata]|uniref:Uncharacterized protein n=1 Tax=Elysia marginata TaxID=1093978 RepID=A0AAV4FTL9_9GAST|nr:hypothetical protein ElyMa_000471000 [Elysia marginata]
MWAVNMDGTFTILVDVGGLVIPLVNILMVNKTTGCYRQVLVRMRRITRQLTHDNWRPQVIIADFKMALWNADGDRIANCDAFGMLLSSDPKLLEKNPRSRTSAILSKELAPPGDSEKVYKHRVLAHSFAEKQLPRP